MTKLSGCRLARIANGQVVFFITKGRKETKYALLSTEVMLSRAYAIMMLVLFVSKKVGSHATVSNVSRSTKYSSTKYFDGHWLVGNSPSIMHKMEKCAEWGGNRGGWGPGSPPLPGIYSTSPKRYKGFC